MRGLTSMFLVSLSNNLFFQFLTKGVGWACSFVLQPRCLLRAQDNEGPISFQFWLFFGATSLHLLYNTSPFNCSSLTLRTKSRLFSANSEALCDMVPAYLPNDTFPHLLSHSVLQILWASFHVPNTPCFPLPLNFLYMLLIWPEKNQGVLICIP